MSKNIIITVGISNSGKSTWAHEQWAKDPQNIIIINRDKIRELLFGYTEETISEYYLRKDISKLEKQVTRFEDTFINEALETGKTPIVDATHLRMQYLERFKYWNVKLNFKFFDVTLKEAQIRNSSRNRRVHQEILIKQYNQYVDIYKKFEEGEVNFDTVEFDNDITKPPCVIFDIDNTLAIRGDRSPYAWLEVGKDLLDTSTALLSDYINSSDLNPKVIICTGRDGESLDETEKWLKLHGVDYSEIYIRDKGDMRPDWVVKEEMWRKIAKDNYIVMMFDDRVQIIRRSRALGIKVAQVEYGAF